MSDDELKELRELDQVAPEKWHIWDRGIGYEVHLGDRCLNQEWSNWTDAKPKPWEKDTRGPEPQGECQDVNDEFRETWSKERAQLAVAARNALPALLDEIDRLRSQLATATEALEALVGVNRAESPTHSYRSVTHEAFTDARAALERIKEKP